MLSLSIPFSFSRSGFWIDASIVKGGVNQIAFLFDADSAVPATKPSKASVIGLFPGRR